MKIKVPERRQLPEGLYPATLTSIEPAENERGSYLRWMFLIPIDGGEELRRVTNSSMSLGRRSKAYGWLTAVMDRNLELGEEIDVGSILPIRCRVVVRRTEDNMYDRIVDVLAAGPGSQAPSRQPAVAPVSDSSEMRNLMESVDAQPESDENDDIPF